MPQTETAPDLQQPDSRDEYLLGVVSQLAAALENILGPVDAVGFISIATQRVVQQIDAWRALTREELAGVLVELQQRLGADFYVSSDGGDTIVLGNRRCPFGSQVLGKRALCMTTSNIVGAIAARTAGYARVDLRKTIAEGDPECLLSVHLTLPPRSAMVKGREYFSSVAIDD